MKNVSKVLLGSPVSGQVPSLDLLFFSIFSQDAE